MYKPKEADIAAWKKEHGEVFLLKSKNKEQPKACVVRRPNRKDLGFAEATSGRDPHKYNETILESIWLDGDKECKTDEACFFGISQQLAGLIQITEFELEKL